MSTALPPLRAKSGRNSHWLSREYLPELEPYIQWIRQPYGWFLLGTISSCLLGAYLSPLAWSIALGLLALLIVGLAYPWLSIRGTSCSIRCPTNHVEEGQAIFVDVLVRNRCPWPVCGLVVEGLLSAASGNMQSAEGDVALSTIPWFSQAKFRVKLSTELRGRYPRQQPTISCAFPLAIWTARRRVERFDPVVVRPRQLKLAGWLECLGHVRHYCGDGAKPHGQNDFVGLRDYLQGDSLRDIHWAHTARTETLIVSQRSTSESASWQVVLDTSCPAGDDSYRDNLTWRVRIAASFCQLLRQQSTHFALVLTHEDSHAEKVSAFRRSVLDSALERLTDVALDGYPAGQSTARPGRFHTPQPASTELYIKPVVDNVDDSTRNQSKVELTVERTGNNLRRGIQADTVVIDLDQDIAEQVNAWLNRYSTRQHLTVSLCSTN